MAGRYEYAISFSPDLIEMYFTGQRKRGNSNIYFSSYKGMEWTKPEIFNLTKGIKSNELEAFVSPSGNELFFATYDCPKEMIKLKTEIFMFVLRRRTNHGPDQFHLATR